MGLDIAIRNNTEAGSYDALLDDRVVGVIEYERVGDRMVFRHTVVEPAFRGRGVASTLVRAALDDLTTNRLSLTNYCGFVTDFISAHPEYAGLQDHGLDTRSRAGVAASRRHRPSRPRPAA